MRALLIGAVAVDHPRAHVVDREECGDRGVGVGELLEDPHAVESTQPASADILGAVDGAHPELSRLTQLLDREVIGRVPLEGMWRKPFGRERRGGLDDDALVVVETARGSGRSSGGHRPQSIVGMTNSAPSLTPDGQRDVTVLVLV